MQKKIYFKTIILIKLCIFVFGIINAYALNKLILVGTTGDYPPLTQRTKDSYTGKDIKIITDFARANDIQIKIIPTTWQNMSSDLTSNKFDIAVGGISNNKARARLFYLSEAIESSAKVALIRCSDQGRLNTFSSIDNESVVVAENRGGTNQDFALQNIKHAILVIYPQNAKSLASLTASINPSDVMFTDDVEVDYRHQLNPLLCKANIPEKFLSGNKVFLFSQTKNGMELRNLFNHWWRLNQQNY